MSVAIGSDDGPVCTETFRQFRTWGRYHGGRRPSSDDSFYNRQPFIGTLQTEYHEALPSSAKDEVRCDCTLTDDGNAS